MYDWDVPRFYHMIGIVTDLELFNDPKANQDEIIYDEVISIIPCMHNHSPNIFSRAHIFPIQFGI